MPKRLALDLIVFVSGAAVLAVEILGTRILGPFFGVNLFLWSALITVTLVALAAGYWAGGRRADRGARLAGLATPLAIAGLWLLLIPWIRAPLLRVAEPFGLRAAVLIAAFVLFAPPLTLLGTVSPYAIRIRARDLAEVGRTAGNLYALSTLASVCAALATGFWLIPSFGVTQLTRLIGVALLTGALVAALADRRDRPPAATLVAILLLGGGALVSFVTPGRAARGPVRALVESPYAEIRVVDSAGRRFLLIDGGIHTIVEPGTWKTYFPYVAVLDLVKNLFERPQRLLLIGLGGGSVAKSYARDGWIVDAVEIDGAVTRVAREHFGLSDSDARVFEMDGREFLLRERGSAVTGGRGAADRYDVIILDAFGSSAIPFHLVTTESFGLVASRLAPEGILAINVEAVGWEDPIVAAIAASLSPHFAHVAALPIAEPPDRLGNLILLAAHRPIDFSEGLLEDPFVVLHDPFLHWSTVQRNHAWDNRFDPRLAGARPFTDDRNRVDVMAERINLAARRALHAEPALAGNAW